jgi:hypothetical protein
VYEACASCKKKDSESVHDTIARPTLPKVARLWPITLVIEAKIVGMMGSIATPHKENRAKFAADGHCQHDLSHAALPMVSYAMSGTA